MTFGETLEWQRCNADHINRLGKQGDKLALQLVNAYQVLYADRLNPKKQSEWMKICDDYVRRELTVTTRVILQDRYGHKPPAELRKMDS